MAESITYTRSVNDGQETRNHRTTLSGGLKTFINETIPGGSTHLQLAIAFTLAKLKFFEIGCETRPVTIKTNSSGSPQETFTLAAGEFVVWDSEDPTAAAPFAGNVTTIYVTLAAGDDAVLEGVLLVDPT